MKQREIEKTCPDCGAGVGHFHDDGCDVARCLTCGLQRIGCGCVDQGEMDVWTGQWPGDACAIRHGLFCRWNKEEGGGWIPCDENHPEAMADLNRLLGECVWNQQTRQWDRKAAA